MREQQYAERREKDWESALMREAELHRSMKEQVGGDFVARGSSCFSDGLESRGREDIRKSLRLRDV